MRYFTNYCFERIKIRIKYFEPAYFICRYINKTCRSYAGSCCTCDKIYIGLGIECIFFTQVEFDEVLIIFDTDICRKCVKITQVLFVPVIIYIYIYIYIGLGIKCIFFTQVEFDEVPYNF